MKKIFSSIIIMTLIISSCTNSKKTAQVFPDKNFDTIVDNKKVSLYTLKNASGMTAQVTNYGARVVDLWVADKAGDFKDVIWGFENIKGYLNATDMFAGPIVGRYGNRIGKGQFTLDGKAYQLTLNNNGHHLHGGINGFYKKVWDARPFKNDKGEDALELSYLSPAGEEGYPGNLTLKVIYAITANNELTINYSATTDAATIINPTSHVYFNLHGTTTQSSNSHVLTIFADKYTPTDSLLIPTGEIATVENTPLDFRKPTTVGERIKADFMALKYGKGYDHNFVLNKKAGEISLAAEVFEPATGIIMKVSTDQPAIQFYSGNFMDGKDTGKRGDKHDYRTGIALEAQNYPDAPNHANFPTAVLKPGETYKQVSIYAFEIKK
jgi:aldose 1-epimerase